MLGIEKAIKGVYKELPVDGEGRRENDFRTQESMTKLGGGKIGVG